MKLRYTPKAVSEQNEIFDFLLERNPQGAQKVARSIQRVLARVVMFPSSCQTTDDPLLRRAVATPYPYAVFYEIGEGEIVVHRVRHTARDPETL